MGKLVEFNFTGPLGNLTAYKMRGVDGIVVRQKGGASKERIKTDPKFINTRHNNAEFGGRATATRWIMLMLRPQKALADHNIAGPLNALMRPVQLLDTVSKKGKRAVTLSKNPRLLEGFSLNQKNTFDGTLRTSLGHSLSRDTLSAHIDIPALLPGINFYAPQRHSMYRVIAMLGVVPDLVYQEQGYEPSDPAYSMINPAMAGTEWYPVLKGSPATALALDIKTTPPDQSFSLMLSVGICYGAMLGATEIEQVKHAGSAKILAMA
jgi:hypothetical protein